MAITAKSITNNTILGNAFVKVQIWNPASGDSGEYQDLTSLIYPIVADDTNHISVKIKVTLNEPPSKASYTQIAGNLIKVYLSFNVAPAA